MVGSSCIYRATVADSLRRYEERTGNVEHVRIRQRQGSTWRNGSWGDNGDGKEHPLGVVIYRRSNVPEVDEGQCQSEDGPRCCWASWNRVWFHWAPSFSSANNLVRSNRGLHWPTIQTCIHMSENHGGTTAGVSKSE